MDATMRETRIRSMRATIVLAVGVLLACAATSWWLQTKTMDDMTLPKVKAWAAWATVALVFAVPGAALGGYLFGRREASVLTDGLRAGVNEVTRAADEVTTFKDKAAARSRQPPIQIAVAPQLPQPQMFHKKIESGETVDL